MTRLTTTRHHWIEADVGCILWAFINAYWIFTFNEYMAILYGITSFFITAIYCYNMGMAEFKRNRPASAWMKAPLQFHYMIHILENVFFAIMTVTYFGSLHLVAPILNMLWWSFGFALLSRAQPMVRKMHPLHRACRIKLVVIDPEFNQKYDSEMYGTLHYVPNVPDRNVRISVINTDMLSLIARKWGE